MEELNQSTATWQPIRSSLPYGVPSDAVVVALAPSHISENIAGRVKSHDDDTGCFLIERMGCSLRNLGWRGPLVALTHNVRRSLIGRWLPQLSPQNWTILRVTADLRRLFLPAGRLPAGSASVEHANPRPDGCATVIKLFAWNLTFFRRVLVVDLDVAMLESPERTLRAADEHQILFQAVADQSTRHRYTGLNTHMMLLRPSNTLCTVLLTNARQGHYVPYTFTEQDVVETALPPVVRADWARNDNSSSSGVTMPHHQHLGFMWFLNTRSRVKCFRASNVTSSRS